MALVTFTSPEYRDKTVYAVAGSHTQTVLKLALENKIPINFECEDGECGTCLVRVTSIDKKNQRMGGPLTEKEKTVLKEVGKVTAEELEKMIVDDLPCEWRLACQMIVRDEDIRVEY
ncbi:2Fe-2S iron-sulfur cluster-binding protein [Methylomonas sp. MED-D]|uniref:Ferredoxin n=1 Tax=Methylomonas koyamae TaxID=702114 RepID=A0A177NC73_9GAMM|nr:MULTISPECIES: 2Fe-2S iron-sulfur cluster binding domain-containing protein [Methylomonas]MDT4332536.1 2Fe-2S iron-sulfur cluster binding domain-containing protein [Methylomonas sp. MV1]OAI15234.1 ferredoxin [Methylomonas koyamae]OHX34651.1 ferredoxin [Methylomonas sp. LWB]